MPINKAARLRFEIIDECLRNTARRWSKAELLRFVNRRLERHIGPEAAISASQLRYDLEAMQVEYGAPLEMYRDGRSYYYRYEEPDFSIKNLPVEEEDLAKLNEAVQLLRQIKGFTIADDMAEIVNRLESRYKFSNTGEVRVISFENAPEMQGIENLEDIYHAILRQKVLKIRYQSFRSQEERVWNIHPYLLKEYGHRWYLLGFTQEKESVGIFALDRMKEIRVSKIAYLPNSFVHAEDYFRDVIGVTVFSNQPIETIELEFSGTIAPYVRTKPLHRSQQILEQEEGGKLVVQLQVAVNPELVSLLLSYGSEVKVLAPASLSQQIRDTAARMVRLYVDRV